MLRSKIRSNQKKLKINIFFLKNRREFMEKTDIDVVTSPMIYSLTLNAKYCLDKCKHSE